ncbi:hypothetical protein [Haloprofundus salinisoli]|uniref:hypothetical protein n=1 Tax=Haloprofundus salinisoli TaxID=2876193 RepID=UPI001CCCFAE4|nr:hypothetical protein [Haloprofundus salinisoli]
MTPSIRERLVAGAVLLGSLGLFGLPTYLLTIGAAEILASVVSGSLSGASRTVASVAAVVLSFAVSTEVAAVRLHGYAALNRGIRAVNLGRHVTLSLAVLAATVVTAEFLVSVFVRAVPRNHTLPLALGSLVAVAVVWAVGRTVRAFYRGYRGNNGV